MRNIYIGNNYGNREEGRERDRESGIKEENCNKLCVVRVDYKVLNRAISNSITIPAEV